MKNILKLTLILAGALMIISCEEDPIVTKADESVVNSASFVTTDYYVVNNPNSLGAIYLNNTQQWKVGDKIRVSGSIKFKRPDDPGYVIIAYNSSCEIKFVTGNAIYVGYDYSGIGRLEGKTAPTHIEFNRGVIELLQLLPGNNG
jgi:hypothetical protein